MTFFSPTYRDADTAFVSIYRSLNHFGYDSGNGTKAIHNVGFYIANPEQNEIRAYWRNWNPVYAEREWQWYLSRDRSVEELKKYAPIWDKMHGGDNIVNSNYGYQWGRENQFGKVIQQLKDNPKTRQAFITIFDGKEKDKFEYDTPCTLSIGFQIVREKLCMTVNMRSNDIWYGFCNDQYCFSKLQMMVAAELDIEIGWYFHNVANMHVYEDQYIENILS